MKRLPCVFVTGSVLFLMTLVLTIVGTRRVLADAPTITENTPFEVWYFIFAFLLMTALVFLLFRLVHGRLLFTVFFSLAMLVGVWFFADIFLPPGIAAFVALLILATRILVPRVFVQNALVVIGVAGVAVSLGLALPWRTLLVIMLILAVYDVVAVYWTGHMVAMMKGLLARGVILAAVLPESVRGSTERLDRIAPHEGFALIGTGDLALPATFVASIAVVDLTRSLIVAAGALAGFALTTIIFLGPDHSKPMPALPPIVLGMVLGILVSFFIM